MQLFNRDMFSEEQLAVLDRYVALQEYELLLEYIETEFPDDTYYELLLLGVHAAMQLKRYKCAYELAQEYELYYPECGNPIFYLYLGQAAEQLGKINESYWAYQDFIEHMPGSYKGHLLLAAIELKHHKYGKALETLNKSIRIFPTQKAYFLHAYALQQLGRYGEAVEDLCKILNEFKESAEITDNDVRFLRAECYAELDFCHETIRDLDTIILTEEDYDKLRECLQLRSKVHKKMGNNNEASRDMKHMDYIREAKPVTLQTFNATPIPSQN